MSGMSCQERVVRKESSGRSCQEGVVGEERGKGNEFQLGREENGRREKDPLYAEVATPSSYPCHRFR